MTLLSEHLSVAEFLHTDADDLIPDQEALWAASPEIRANAMRMAVEVFEPAREALGCPLRVTSGLRCPPLNHLVGGKPDSRHLFGLAIDCIPQGLDPLPAIYVLLHAIRRGQIQGVDKVIIEGKPGRAWLHLQAAADGREARRMVMESEDGRVFAPLAGRMA
jgi:hypothetical protein